MNIIQLTRNLILTLIGTMKVGYSHRHRISTEIGLITLNITNGVNQTVIHVLTREYINFIPFCNSKYSWSKCGLNKIVLFRLSDHLVLNTCQKTKPSKTCDGRSIGSTKESSALLVTFTLKVFSKQSFYGSIEYCVNIHFCRKRYSIVLSCRCKTRHITKH